MTKRGLTMIAAMALLLGMAWVQSPLSAAEVESSMARGGKLYDNWFKELKQTRPDETHPAYPASGKYPKQSWRCKECHGWDFKGKDGQFGKNDHTTGIKGVTGMAGKDPKAIAAIIMDAKHAYSGKLGDKDAMDMALFISKGLPDLNKYIDASGKPKGNPGKGEVYFNTLCAGCHGTDGKKVSTGAAVGALKDDPWQLLHKSLNGQSGEAMPALRSLDPSVASDILSHAQSLPE
ncbi:MAG: c-type cytochrome [Alphaproteobacteria bacterium]|jgi:cytochrome c553|nr:c-type cytochrome [Alphaproteobacteria bacterium]